MTIVMTIRGIMFIKIVDGILDSEGYPASSFC
jgi:hypothetical protein